MTYKELRQLKDGCLIQILGLNVWGQKEDKLIFFHSESLSSKGYMFGSCLYPLNWLKIPSKKRVNDQISKIRQRAEQEVIALAKAYNLIKL